jgi:hypothetical protein
VFHKPYRDVTAAARLVRPCSMENGKMGVCVVAYPREWSSYPLELFASLTTWRVDDRVVWDRGCGNRYFGLREVDWERGQLFIVTFVSPPLSGATGNVSRSSSRIHRYAAMGCGACG